MLKYLKADKGDVVGLGRERLLNADEFVKSLEHLLDWQICGFVELAVESKRAGVVCICDESLGTVGV